MKMRWLLLGLLILDVVAVAKADAAGLVAHWTFDEGMGSLAADSSPNGYDAMLFAGAGWTNGVLTPVPKMRSHLRRSAVDPRRSG